MSYTAKELTALMAGIDAMVRSGMTPKQVAERTGIDVDTLRLIMASGSLHNRISGPASD